MSLQVYIDPLPDLPVVTQVAAYAIFYRAAGSAELAITVLPVAPTKLPSWLSLPAIQGYQGRVLYLRADQLVMSDVRELWKPNMQGPRTPPIVRCRTVDVETSIMDDAFLMLDCHAAQALWQFDPRKLSAVVREHSDPEFPSAFRHAFWIYEHIGQLPAGWDVPADPRKTTPKVVNYAGDEAPPWRNPDHRHALSWRSTLLAAIKVGVVKAAAVREAVAVWEESAGRAGIHPEYASFLKAAPVSSLPKSSDDPKRRAAHNRKHRERRAEKQQCDENTQSVWVTTHDAAGQADAGKLPVRTFLDSGSTGQFIVGCAHKPRAATLDDAGRVRVTALTVPKPHQSGVLVAASLRIALLQAAESQARYIMYLGPHCRFKSAVRLRTLHGWFCTRYGLQSVNHLHAARRLSSEGAAAIYLGNAHGTVEPYCFGFNLATGGRILIDRLVNSFFEEGWPQDWPARLHTLFVQGNPPTWNLSQRLGDWPGPPLKYSPLAIYLDHAASENGG